MTAENMDLAFFGITRFSVVLKRTLGAFRATQGKTVQEAKAAVWEKERLAKRMWFFENFSLPTYRMNARLNANSHGIIVVNRAFPLKNRVKQLCAEVPNLSVLEVTINDNHHELIKAHIRALVQPGQRIFNYRYDDDDALSSEFLSKVEEHARNTGDGGCISFTSGYSLSRVGPNEFGLHVRKYPLNAFGLGILSHSDNLQLIFEKGAHTKITSEVTHDSKTIGWLSPVHDGNDSRIGEFKGKPIGLDEIAGTISKQFPQIDVTRMEQLSLRRTGDFD